METVLAICVIAIVILAVTQRSLQLELKDLRETVLRLRQELSHTRQAQDRQPSAQHASEPPASTLPADQAFCRQETEPPVPAHSTAVAAAPIAGSPAEELRRPMREPQPAPQNDLERQFGGRAFVWIGGVALALAGFFLVKYSIETGILTETVRVVLGVVFGLLLLGASHAIHRIGTLTDGKRISQALAGAGIADLYGSLFAATTLYHLVPSWLGFAGMAVVTATALVLSLRQGAAIALLGLVGGFATPLLIHGEPNAPLLFGYLYLVAAGLLAVARDRDWWWLPVPALGLSFLWVLAWLALQQEASNAIVLPVFLLAISLTAIGFNHARTADDNEPGWMRILAPGGAIIVLAVVAFNTQFGLFEWGTFALISAAALTLSYFDPKTYRGVPWLAIGANAVMLAGWFGAPPLLLTAILVGFAVLFGAGAQVLIRTSPAKPLWAGLSATAAITYFLLAYFKLQRELAIHIGSPASDYVWAGIALAAAGWFAYAVTEALVLTSAPHHRQVLQAIYAATSTALVALAAIIVLNQDYFALALIGEIFALSWISTRLDVAALRVIAMVLAGFSAWMMLPSLGASFVWGKDISLWRETLHYAFPAGLSTGAAIFWRQSKDDRFVTILELAGVLLAAIFIYRTIDIFLAGSGSDMTLAMQGLQTAILFIGAFAAMHFSGQTGRKAYGTGGKILAAGAGLRVLAYAVLLYNPLSSHQWSGPLPLLNIIALAYGVPAVAAIVMAHRFEAESTERRIAPIAAYGLGAITIALWVRQIFQGNYLDAAGTSSAEVYAYSAAGLLAGVALLLAAVARGDAMMRVASLVVMLATVGKVFLLDAAELTGLWRVISFLGLGLSLLGLSWFYSRFVFKPKS